MKREAILFILNGGIATAVHFTVLILLIEKLDVQSLVHANIVAGVAGVSYSFLGNKYFVFNFPRGNIYYQASKFILIYICIIFFHTLILNISTNVYGLDYRASFVIASLIIIIISFLSNKFMVFRQ